MIVVYSMELSIFKPINDLHEYIGCRDHCEAMATQAYLEELVTALEDVFDNEEGK